MNSRSPISALVNPALISSQHLALARRQRGSQLAGLWGRVRPVSPSPRSTAAARSRAIVAPSRSKHASAALASTMAPGVSPIVARTSASSRRTSPSWSGRSPAARWPAARSNDCDRGGAVPEGDEDTAVGDRCVGAQRGDVDVGRECGELLGGRPGGVDVAALQFDIDERRRAAGRPG